MQAVVSHKPLFLAAQLEPPPSGRGCPLQVSRVNSHIWGLGGGLSLSSRKPVTVHHVQQPHPFTKGQGEPPCAPRSTIEK